MHEGHTSMFSLLFEKSLHILQQNTTYPYDKDCSFIFPDILNCFFNSEPNLYLSESSRKGMKSSIRADKWHTAQVEQRYKPVIGTVGPSRTYLLAKFPLAFIQWKG